MKEKIDNLITEMCELSRDLISTEEKKELGLALSSELTRMCITLLKAKTVYES